MTRFHRYLDGSLQRQQFAMPSPGIAGDLGTHSHRIIQRVDGITFEATIGSECLHNHQLHHLVAPRSACHTQVVHLRRNDAGVVRPVP